MASRETIAHNLTLDFLRGVGAELGLMRHGEPVPDLRERPQYHANLKIAQDCLKAGWTERELKDEIWCQYRQGARAALLSEILPKRAPSKELDPQENLLEPEEVYLHPALFESIPAQLTFQDGELVSIATASRTRKEQFTLQNLAERTRLSLGPGIDPKSRETLGGLSYLIRTYGLDAVLFGMDAAGRDSGAGSFPIREILDLKRYVLDAVSEVEYRRRGNV